MRGSRAASSSTQRTSSRACATSAPASTNTISLGMRAPAAVASSAGVCGPAIAGTSASHG